MNEMRVNGTTNNFTIVISELFCMVAEINDFSGTYECEIKRVEEKEDPFLFKVSEGEFLEFVFGRNPRICLEERS